MRVGEADWVLWGLALQNGLCPRDRHPLTLTVHSDSCGHEVHYCPRCYREWYLHPESGHCRGWWLTPSGWYYDADRRPVFRET